MEEFPSQANHHNKIYAPYIGVVYGKAWRLTWTPETHVLQRDWPMCSTYGHHSTFNSEHDWEGMCDHFKSLNLL